MNMKDLQDKKDMVLSRPSRRSVGVIPALRPRVMTSGSADAPSISLRPFLAAVFHKGNF